MTIVASAAPMRLDFAGGWTDVPPFSAREGGVVVNAAIALWAHVRLESGRRSITLVSEDQDARAELASPDRTSGDGRLALLEAALRLCRPAGGCLLSTRSDAPPGSGLGSSGALDVALVAAFAEAAGEHPSRDALADRGWRLEAIEAGNPGGKQDQLAAALGGFQRLTFRDPAVTHQPLPVTPELAAELEQRIVLCYTGTSRVSGATISRVVRGYEQGDRGIVGALHGIRDAAHRMAELLPAGDLAEIGRLLRDNWTHQQALDPIMRTPAMARLEQAMDGVGSLGGKAAGSGAGGCMFFLFPDPPAAERGRAAASAADCRVLPMSWASCGVTVTLADGSGGPSR